LVELADALVAATERAMELNRECGRQSCASYEKRKAADDHARRAWKEVNLMPQVAAYYRRTDGAITTVAADAAIANGVVVRATPIDAVREGSRSERGIVGPYHWPSYSDEARLLREHFGLRAGEDGEVDPDSVPSEVSP
jgi:hypothetical protein